MFYLTIIAALVLNTIVWYLVVRDSPEMPENMQEDEDSYCPPNKRLHVDENGLWEEDCVSHHGYYDPKDPFSFGV